MSISVRLRSLMEQRGLNLTELAKRSGLAVSSISRYLSGRQLPSVNALTKLARALGVSLEELAGSVSDAALTSREEAILYLEQLKNALLRDSQTGSKKTPKPKGRRQGGVKGRKQDGVAEGGLGFLIPLYSGVPGSEACSRLGALSVPATVLDERAYAIEIRNDSNAPRLSPGDIAVFSPQRAWKNGDVCAVVTTDGSAIIGQVRRRNRGVLVVPVKHGSSPVRVTLSSTIAIHKLIWIKSD